MYSVAVARWCIFFFFIIFFFAFVYQDLTALLQQPKIVRSWIAIIYSKDDYLSTFFGMNGWMNTPSTSLAFVFSCCFESFGHVRLSLCLYCRKYEMQKKSDPVTNRFWIKTARGKNIYSTWKQGSVLGNRYQYASVTNPAQLTVV